MFISHPTVEILKKLIKTGDPERRMPWRTTRPRANECFIDVYITTTVDGRTPANQLRLVVYPNIYKAFYIPGGFLAGFLNHQPITGRSPVFQVKTHPNHGRLTKNLVFRTRFEVRKPARLSGPQEKASEQTSAHRLKRTQRLVRTR